MRRSVYWGLGVVAALLAAFAFVAEDVVEGETRAFDEAILLMFRVPGHPDTPIGPAWFVEAVRDTTSLGGYVILTLITIAVFVYLLIVKQRANAILVAGAVISGTILSNTLKNVFGRQRPDLTGIVEIFTPSFPSGHALVSAVTYLTIAAILVVGTQNRALRVFYIALAALLTILIGLSRLYLGVHYPTDVFCGWCLGAAWAIGWFIAASLIQERVGARASTHD